MFPAALTIDAATVNPPVTMPVVERCSNAEWGGVPVAATAAKSPRILDSSNARGDPK